MTALKPPIIGITTYSRSEANEFTLPATYGDAVQLAGGVPVLLPPSPAPDRLLDVVDGLLLTGGGDIDPARYGGSPHPTIYLVDEERDQFELTLAQLVLAGRPIPTLGICRGMQVLSVASEAELIPHVPEQYGEAVAHRLDHPRRPIQHEVSAQPNSRLAEILGQTRFEIVSWHHQAIRTVPTGWQAVAAADDGLIEALEHQQHPWLVAVQWHPELSPSDPVQQRLFQAFVEAASVYSSKRFERLDKN